MLHLANPNTSTLKRRDELDDICLDDDDDDLCSIDNLDACVTFEDDECCIENLDACFDEEGNTKSALLGNSNASNEPISLERFFAQPIVEVQLALLVVLSSLLVGLGTLSNLPPSIAALTKNAELVISAIFTVEYLARWSLENFSAKFVVGPWLLSILLLFYPDLSSSRWLLALMYPPAC